MEKPELQSLLPVELISKYKYLIRNAPSVVRASDEELDKYYDQVLALEDEMKRRMESVKVS